MRPFTIVKGVLCLLLFAAACYPMRGQAAPNRELERFVRDAIASSRANFVTMLGPAITANGLGGFLLKSSEKLPPEIAYCVLDDQPARSDGHLAAPRSRNLVCRLSPSSSGAEAFFEVVNEITEAVPRSYHVVHRRAGGCCSYFAEWDSTDKAMPWIVLSIPSNNPEETTLSLTHWL